jgi:hypothetical protein
MPIDAYGNWYPSAADSAGSGNRTGVPDATYMGYGSYDEYVKRRYGISPQTPVNNANNDAAIAAAKNVGPQADANTRILQNTAATTAPGYRSSADLLAEQNAQNAARLGQGQLNETVRSDQAQENLSSTAAATSLQQFQQQMQERIRAAQAAETLAQQQRQDSATNAASDLALRTREFDATNQLATTHEANQQNQYGQSLQEQIREAQAAEAERQREATMTADEQQREANMADAARSAGLAETSRSSQADEAERALEARNAEGLSQEQQDFLESSTRNRQAAIAGLMSTIQGMQSPTIPGSGGGGTAAPAGGGGGTAGGSADVSPYDMAAESAAYGSAKDQIGNEGASALRGLRNYMNARGIGGSGIEAHGAQGVFGQMQQALGSTDRQLAENRAGRVFDAQQGGLQRAETAREFNVSADQNAAALQADIMAKRLAAILQVGSLY